MAHAKRPPAFWVISAFLVLFTLLLLVGQSTAIFAYDFAVSMGLQESVEDVTPFGVEVNRAFGLGDTVVYIPIIVTALVGLVRRRRWALPVTGAAAGISIYWVVTIGAIMRYFRGLPGFALDPGIEYAVFMGTFAVFGIWCLFYVAMRGERLVD